MAVTPNVINKIKKVEYSVLEPSNKGVLWAEPTGEDQYTYRVYDNGQWNVVSSGGGGDIPTNISYFYNDVGYITMEDLPSDLYEMPETGIPSTDLDSDVQTSLGKADSAYQLPSGGIPSTDLSSDVQTSLGKADTALQSFTETDPTVPSWAKASSKPSYTASEVGAVPTTRKVNNKALSSDITLSASDVSAVPTTRTVNGKALSSNITLSASDVGAQATLTTQTAYTSKGSATKVPQITTNTLGQVTGITEVTITQPDISNCVQKSSTAGLLKNDGTIDTNTYVTASTAPVTSVNSQTGAVSLNGLSLVNDSIQEIIDVDDEYANIGYFGDSGVSTIEFQGDGIGLIAQNANNDTGSLQLAPDTVSLYIGSSYLSIQDGQDIEYNGDHLATTEWVEDSYAHKVEVVDVIPISLDPNKVYQMGTLTGTVTIPAFASVAAGDTEAKIWCFTFATSSTAPTITWPAAITSWVGGTPTINASKSYEVTVMDGIGAIMEA